MAVALAIVVRVFALTVTREREFLADILAPEVARLRDGRPPAEALLPVPL